ncbi:MAG: FkbM family methyltransferase [Verrucomicrobiota bacterium]
MDYQIRLALLLAQTPLHGLFRRAHRKLSRYMDLAENWNNGDERSNGEALLTRLIGPHLHSVFDIGANLGNWTALLLEANPECVTYAFEPSPQTYLSLKSRYKSWPNVRVFQTGLGDQKGTLQFHDYGDNSGLSSFLSREGSVGLKAERVIEVPITTLDAFCAEHSLSHIDFVKVDTEGYEMAVLRGMSSSLGQRRISMIQFEYGGTWLDAFENLANANQLLQRHGYCLFRLRQTGLEKVNYDSRRHECFKYSNFVAVASPEIITRWRIPTVKS